MPKSIGAFQCSKYTLVGLNFFYIIVGIILISLGTEWSNSNRVTSLPIIGGVVACGVFLILISIMGIFGAIRHHQVLLFFYMVILFSVFLIQFSVACACLAVSKESQVHLASQGWKNLNNGTLTDIQNGWTCCGFNEEVDKNYPHPSCPVTCVDPDTSPCQGSSPDKNCCLTCEDKIIPLIGKGFNVVGGVSLFFSFTEIIGGFFAYRYRNLYGGQVS